MGAELDLFEDFLMIYACPDISGEIRDMDEYCGCELESHGGCFCYIDHSDEACRQFYREASGYHFVKPEPGDYGENCGEDGCPLSYGACLY